MKKKDNRENISKPVENHVTAAWADIKTVAPESKVPVPSLDAVIQAKEWVDNVQK